MVDASKSKSYILAMKTLQQKLEAKEKKISLLEKVVEEQKSHISHMESVNSDSIGGSINFPNFAKMDNMNIKKVETAKFGLRNSDKLANHATNSTRNPDSVKQQMNSHGSSYYNNENIHPNTNMMVNSMSNRMNSSGMNHHSMEVNVLLSTIKKQELQNKELKNDNCELAKELQEIQQAMELNDNKIEILRE